MPTTKKRKTKKKINIQAYKESEDQINLNIEGEEITCKVYSTGRIKFTFKHPELKKKFKYDGIVEDSTLFLYPIIGDGVLTTEPIKIQDES